jgi:DNA (cytosine-5)-methyltransferase 1
MTKAAPRAIDLFCGCGGLTVGLKRAGFKVIGAVDVDQRAIESYRANHRGIRVWETDISKLSVTDVQKGLRLKHGQLELLAGCPPCQGFSNLRTRNGARRRYDMRNSLIDEFLRFVRELLPKAVLLENVPALADHWRFSRFRRELAELGYSSTYAIQDAADFGVAQRRRRLIYLGVRGRQPKLPKAARTPRTVRDVIADLKKPGLSGDRLHDLPENRSESVRRLIRAIPKDGGSRLQLPRRLWLECHLATDGFRDVYGRMQWRSPAPTITSGCHNPSKGRFLHPSQNRTITLREAAMLQGFPYSYKFSESAGKEELALQIGNALPPQMVTAHAKALRELWKDRGPRTLACRTHGPAKRLV